VPKKTDCDRVGPKSTDRCPYKRKAEGDVKQKHREGDSVETEAGIGVVQRQARNAEVWGRCP
jgi:hypothetical protein